MKRFLYFLIIILIGGQTHIYPTIGKTHFIVGQDGAVSAPIVQESVQEIVLASGPSRVAVYFSPDDDLAQKLNILLQL